MRQFYSEYKDLLRFQSFLEELLVSTGLPVFSWDVSTAVGTPKFLGPFVGGD
jgi:hypothetical protein